MAFWNGTEWVEDAPAPSTLHGRGRGFLGIATQAVLMAALVLALTAGSVFAGQKGSSSIALVVVSASIASLDSSGPNHGDTVTFDVRTTATERPYVLLNCYQSGAWVYAAQAGFWASYPWGQNFTLDADSWSSGAANCTARLGALNADGTKFRELARTSFNVAE
jgi:hypothetical protein